MLAISIWLAWKFKNNIMGKQHNIVIWLYYAGLTRQRAITTAGCQ